MASRSHGLFDEAQLLPSDRLVRSGTARLRIPEPPYWWEGTLILTSDRLFFLPHVDQVRLDQAAFWLHHLTSWERAGRNRFRVAAAGEESTFHLIGGRPGPAALIGDQAGAWLQAIASLQRNARPRTAFADKPRRRAAG
jgi:hypothetical protein